jgi:hypothetical protein
VFTLLFVSSMTCLQTRSSRLSSSKSLNLNQKKRLNFSNSRKLPPNLAPQLQTLPLSTKWLKRKLWLTSKKCFRTRNSPWKQLPRLTLLPQSLILMKV